MELTIDPTTPAVLLVDDLRVFRAPAPAVVARTSAEGIDALRSAHAARHRWAQIWLDHDLGDATGTRDEIGPLVDWMCARAHAADPVLVDVVLVHTSNGPGGSTMVRCLERAGYRTMRVRAEDYFTIDEALFTTATRHV